MGPWTRTLSGVMMRSVALPMRCHPIDLMGMAGADSHPTSGGMAGAGSHHSHSIHLWTAEHVGVAHPRFLQIHRLLHFHLWMGTEGAGLPLRIHRLLHFHLWIRLLHFHLSIPTPPLPPVDPTPP